MEKITSFTIDHIKLQPGLYVSRKDKVGAETVTTFDLRLTKPNDEPVMNTAEVHTIEHLAATYLRNEPTWKDKVLYFGPMGCQTGFYFLFDSQRLTDAQAIDLLRQVFAQGAVWNAAMPGKSSRECGNYNNLDVALARECCAFYAGIIDGWTVEKLVYPE